jgi:hypothetical protein
MDDLEPCSVAASVQVVVARRRVLGLDQVGQPLISCLEVCGDISLACPDSAIQVSLADRSGAV